MHDTVSAQVSACMWPQHDLCMSTKPAAAPTSPRAAVCRHKDGEGMSHSIRPLKTVHITDIHRSTLTRKVDLQKLPQIMLTICSMVQDSIAIPLLHAKSNLGCTKMYENPIHSHFELWLERASAYLT